LAAPVSDGCASGTVTTTPAPGNLQYTLLFGAFEAVVGDSAVGSLSVPTALPADTRAGYAAHYPALAHPAAGRAATLAIPTANGDEQEAVQGEFDDDFFHSGRLASGPSQSIDATISLAITPDGSDNTALADLDSLDLNEIGRTTYSSVSAS